MARYSANEPPAVHWSKDFVEHLRTVHFTLIAVCVGVILILARTSSASLYEIREILKLKDYWPGIDMTGREILNDAQANAQARNLFTQSPHLPFDFRGDRIVVAKFRSGTVQIQLPDPSWYCDDEKQSKYAYDVREFPTTLGEFRVWWNQLLTARHCHFPVSLKAHGSRKQICNCDFPKREQFKLSSILPSDGGRGSIGSHLSAEILFAEPFGYWATDDLEGGYDFELYVYSQHDRVLDQKSLVDFAKAQGWEWKEGFFDTSFAALAQDADELDAKDLDKVFDDLSTRLTSRADEFEAIGIKFPIAKLTVWGAAILLGVQLYFFLYLRQIVGQSGAERSRLGRPLDMHEQTKAAWCVNFMTVFCLPVLAVLLIAERAAERLTTGYPPLEFNQFVIWVHGLSGITVAWLIFYFFIVVVAVRLSILCWIFRPRITANKSERCPAQRFE
jgi:hypothetical protein